MDLEETFRWADEAVGFVIRKVRPDLVHTWRGVKAGDLGIIADDWLKMSADMVKRFVTNSGLPCKLTEAQRRPYRTKRLIEFTLFIADEAI